MKDEYKERSAVLNHFALGPLLTSLMLFLYLDGRVVVGLGWCGQLVNVFEFSKPLFVISRVDREREAQEYEGLFHFAQVGVTFPFGKSSLTKAL